MLGVQWMRILGWIVVALAVLAVLVYVAIQVFLVDSIQ
jgi:hypothetical protein